MSAQDLPLPIAVAAFLRATVNLKMARFLAPKLKDEYVSAIMTRTPVSQDVLKSLTTDRLKEVWRAVKPAKAVKVLPANWKKFDLQSLKDLYADTCLEFYGLPDDGHWLRYRKSQLIVELEMYQGDKQKEEEENPTTDWGRESNPLCPRCGIPMLERVNRLTQQPFYGCMLYTSC